MFVTSNFQKMSNCQSQPLLAVAGCLEDVFINYRVCLLDYLFIDNLESANTLLQINQSDIDLVIVVNDHRGCPNGLKLISMLTKPCLVLDWVESSDYLSIKYPYWIIHYPRSYQIIIVTPNTSNTRRFLFSCLNHNIRPVKITNLIHFHQSTYWDRSLITFPKINYYDNEYFNSNINTLLPLTMNFDDPILMRYDSLAFMDTYINVAIETFIDADFISEKTLKSIMAEQMFVLVGCVNNLNVLRQAGFDVFDDIIDHSYETYTLIDDRVSAVHKLLNTMQHWDWPSIYQKTASRRKANRELLLSDVFLVDAVNQIKHKLNLK